MVHMRFSSLLMLGFLFVMHDIRDYSSVYALDEETNRNVVPSDHQEYAACTKKEVVDGVSSINLRKPWLEGRKMAAYKILGEELEKDISGANRPDGKCEFEGIRRGSSDTKSSHKLKGGHSIDETSKKSLGRFHHQVDDQKMQFRDSKMLRSSELNPSSSDTKNVTEETDHDHQKVEAQRQLLMATKEIVNLIHKDYKGMDKPRRKPPINNHEPWH